MIICSCNNIREREIRNACTTSVSCADEVMDALGCEFKCNRCMPYIQEMLCSFQNESCAATKRVKKSATESENSLQQRVC